MISKTAMNTYKRDQKEIKELKAQLEAALPKCTRITDDPATWPVVGQQIVFRVKYEGCYGCLGAHQWDCYTERDMTSWIGVIWWNVDGLFKESTDEIRII